MIRLCFLSKNRQGCQIRTAQNRLLGTTDEIRSHLSQRFPGAAPGLRSTATSSSAVGGLLPGQSL